MGKMQQNKTNLKPTETPSDVPREGKEFSTSPTALNRNT